MLNACLGFHFTRKYQAYRLHPMSFGWEDAAAAETIISGNWRADYNGSQHYLHEDDGLEYFTEWKNNKYKRKHHDEGKFEDDDLVAMDGWNLYDQGWDDCKLKEQTLKESFDGKMTQDNLAQQQHPNTIIPVRVSTHVLASASDTQMLHWKKIDNEEEHIDELTEYLCELLREKNVEVRTLAKKFERLDRRNTGVLERHKFESVLQTTGLLNLLSVRENEDLMDRYATSEYVTIKYRAFIRSLTNPKETASSKTIIAGRWNSDQYQARIVVRCNRTIDDEYDEYDEMSYEHVDFAKKQRRIR